jgi:hypothetical protein
LTDRNDSESVSGRISADFGSSGFVCGFSFPPTDFRIRIPEP